MQGSLDRSHLA